MPADRVRRGVSWWWLPAVVALAVQLWGIYRPEPPPSVPGIPQLDKVAHLASFAAPVALFALAIDATRRRWGTAGPNLGRTTVVALAFALHAALSEIVQALFYRRRTGDPLDLLADLAGVGVGVVLARLLLNRSRR